jgi:ribosomal protein L40E
MMNRNSGKMQCAFCQARLAWWNASSCAYCGHAICQHHAHLVKRAHNSSVLSSVCEKCAAHAGLHIEAIATSQMNGHLAHTHQQHAVAR